jgi:two-component system, NarL family, response regulator
MSGRAPIRVLLVDDHPVVRSGLLAILQSGGITVAAQAATGKEAIDRYFECSPDVVLMDLKLPDLDGWTAISAIRARDANARVIAISSFSGDEDIHRALRSGAKGYLMKDADASEIVSAVRAVYEGLRYVPPAAAAALASRMAYETLSERECQILKLIARGNNNREIGAALGVSESTVKWHINSLLSKLGVDDRTAAVTVARERGILHL